MVLQAPPVTRLWALTRTATWALLGAFGGFLIGVLISTYSCHDGLMNCYPTEAQKIILLTAAGLLTGLLAELFRRSMTDERRGLMTTLTVILLLLLAFACFKRISPWSCSENADCFNAPGVPFATT